MRTALILLIFAVPKVATKNQNVKTFFGATHPSSLPDSDSIAMSPAYKKRKLSPSPAGDIKQELPQSVPARECHREEGDVADNSISTQIRRPMRNDKEDKSKVLPNGAYSSTMFQLQVDELLVKARPAKGRMGKAENALRKLKDLIEHIPNREPRSVRRSLNLLNFQV